MRREGAHVDANLGNEACRGDRAYSRKRLGQSDSFLEGLQHPIHLLLQVGQRRFKEVDMGEHLLEQRLLLRLHAAC